MPLTPSTQVPLLAQGVEAQARESGGRQKIRPCRLPPPGRRGGPRGHPSSWRGVEGGPQVGCLDVSVALPVLTKRGPE